MKVIKKASLSNAESISIPKYLICRPDGVSVKIGSSTGSVVSDPNMRCFFVSNSMDTLDKLNAVKAIVISAASVGFNCLMLSSSCFDSFTNTSLVIKNNLVNLKQFCNDWGVELAPICFSVGYAGRYTRDGINSNFAASYPCSMDFVVQNGLVNKVAETDLACKEILFDSFTSNAFPGFYLQGGIGTTSFLDLTVSYAGTKSCRFTDVQNSAGYGRLVLQVDTEANKSYEVSFWAKCSEDWAGQEILLQATQTNTTRSLMSVSKVPTTVWAEYKLQFNSLDCNLINIALGVWGGTTGSFWVDNIKIKRQDKLQMVIQRDKTLFDVCNKVTGEKYHNGVHYNLDLIQEYPEMIYEIKPLSIPSNTIIKVDFYRSYWRDSWGGNHAICVDAEEMQQYFDIQTQEIFDLLKPRVWQFSTDEIRQGGYDEESKEKTMSESISTHLKKRKQKVDSLIRNSVIFTSGDIFDPSMNAKTPYYSCKGFESSWGKLSKDIKPTVWSFAKRDEGLNHFISKGFDPLASINIDECSTTTELQSWKDSLDAVNFKGIVRYTTWINNYSRLSEFSDVFFS